MSPSACNKALPPRGGIGLKPEHYRDLLEGGDTSVWVEVHPENYMVAGGPRLTWLEAIREGRALSFHGVGASLGGLDRLDQDHLSKLKALIERYQPEQVSEHAAWCARHGRYYSDLLPLPRTYEALRNIADNVDAFQAGIGRRILLENPTNYLPFASEMDEPDFLVAVAKTAGCGLLLDVNNVWISGHNVGFDPREYIRQIPAGLVDEIHVAGHSEDPNLGPALLIDSHAAAISEEVWDLLAFTLDLFGPKPVLVERDADIPAFAELKAERDRADTVIKKVSGAEHVAA
ncbi:MAG: DUF692 domain-containing protein [Henriciella sp.]|nr:DUF692 domain-containing protein [Henriciella sp.]